MSITLKSPKIDGIKVKALKIDDLKITLSEPKEAPKELLPDDWLKRFLLSEGITGITGPEGAGKSAMMTGKSCDVADYCKREKTPFRLLTFPGYDVYDENGWEADKNGKPIMDDSDPPRPRGNVISEPISTEEWSSMPPSLNQVLIAIDEIENFFSSNMWQTRMVDIFTGVMGERRKRGMAILYTLQFWNELPKKMRQKTHFLVSIRDMWWDRFKLDKPPANRGLICRYDIMDNLGFASGDIGDVRGNMYFRPPRYYKRYNTYGVVSIFEKFNKIKVIGKEHTVDPWGQLVTDKQIADDAIPDPQMEGKIFNRRVQLHMALKEAGYDIRETTKISSNCKTLDNLNTWLKNLGVPLDEET